MQSNRLINGSVHCSEAIFSPLPPSSSQPAVLSLTAGNLLCKAFLYLLSSSLRFNYTLKLSISLAQRHYVVKLNRRAFTINYLQIYYLYVLYENIVTITIRFKTYNAYAGFVKDISSVSSCCLLLTSAHNNNGRTGRKYLP